LKHALPNDYRTDDEAEYIYQRTNEKGTIPSNETARTTAGGLRMPTQPMNASKPPPGAPGGLAAAMHTASKQEQMMPGHRLREKATGK
jgi:hypothetical protein